MSRASVPLAGFQVTLIGRFWVTPEDARAVFYQYYPKLNADLSELVDLLSEHPVIRLKFPPAGFAISE